MTTTTAPTAPEQGKHVKHVKAALSVASSPVTGVTFTYLFHLVMAFALNWALAHGWHIDIGVLPLSLTTFFGSSLGKYILQDLAHAWHKGAVTGQHQGQKNVMTLMASELAKTDPAGLAKILGNLGPVGEAVAKDSPYL